MVTESETEVLGQGDHHPDTLHRFHWVVGLVNPQTDVERPDGERWVGGGGQRSAT